MLNSAAEEGKSLTAYRAIIAQTNGQYIRTFNTLFAVPWTNLSLEKCRELKSMYTYLAGEAPLSNDCIKPIQSTSADGDITYIQVAICRYEHCFTILSRGILIASPYTGLPSWQFRETQ
jgi:hypothetical protein